MQGSSGLLTLSNQPSVPSPKSLGLRCVQNGPPARREEGAYLNRYVTDKQRGRRPIFNATSGPRPVGCFSALLARPISIQIWVLRSRQFESRFLKQEEEKHSV